MSTVKIFIAGFGGQGILFAGKFLASKGLMENLQVSWLPSYGAEMRGGTANCSVILSDSPVGSPIVDRPDILIAMNLPSLEKYVGAVVPGGRVFVDSSLIDIIVGRDDVETFYIPATRMANDAGVPTLANMVMMGNVLKNCPELSYDNAELTVEKLVPAKKPEMLEYNLKALRAGHEYE